MDDLALNVNSLVMFDDSLNKSSNYVTNNIASNIHPRLDGYKKASTTYSNQEERRKNILIEQKKKRSSLTNKIRNVNVEIISKSVIKSPNNSPNTKVLKEKYSSLYNNQLMFSEWLEEKPDDFEVNWIMVVCPVGKRCLVVATDGITTVYNKAGKQICKHSSSLPGGNKESKTDYTILDCIFNYELQTYYVLDVLVYKSHPVMDSETDFRFYWLKCKLNEADNLDGSYYGNPYKFQDLPRSHVCSNLSIQSILEKPFNFQIDGLLFYHKETHYTSGHIPLVLWLKAYMLPEILNIPIPSWIEHYIPSDYKGFRDTINKSNIEQKKIEAYLAGLEQGSKNVQDLKSNSYKQSINKDNLVEEGYKFKFNDSSFKIRHFNISDSTISGEKDMNISYSSEQ